MTAFDVPLFIRGELIEADWVEFGAVKTVVAFVRLILIDM